LIELKNVTKKYNNFKAVDDISFKIEEGEIVGFLGPNGAGKSTTMSMITGYIEPTKGKIIVNGYDIDQKAKQAKRQIGYMPENVPLYTELTVKEFISYMADLKLVKRKDKKSEIERVLNQTGLNEVKSKLIRNLSRGYRQRVSLAGALVGNPPILILDEPTVGLDPKQVTEIRNLIKSLKEKHTILISSHILSEINQMCNKIIIINKGKIVKVDKTENIESETLSSNSDKKELLITVEEETTTLSDITKKLKPIKSVTLINQKDKEKQYSISYEGDENVKKELLKLCIDKDINVVEVKKKEISLEDAFLKIIDEDSTSNKEKGGKK